MNKKEKLTSEQTFQRNTLCMKYPALRKYIIQCFNENNTEELFEFLNGIQLTDIEVEN